MTFPPDDEGLRALRRFVASMSKIDGDDPVAVAACRANQDTAIAFVTRYLRQVPYNHPEWPAVMAFLGVLRLRRYADPWPQPPEPDRADLDAARDLLLAAAERDPDEEAVHFLIQVLERRMALDPRDDDRDAYIAWAGWLLGDVTAGLTGGREPGAKTMLRFDLVGQLV